uniref:hypothetical protein n=1 Tax=Candidatus Enterovibrio escicola TaxID=1927127 RepID=UPI001237F023|nr:hypothetical protein [Candidatus Enterovibrio escacola]
MFSSISTTSARLSSIAWEKTPNFFRYQTKNKHSLLSVREVITIHQSGYRDFKTYYIYFVCC